MVIVRSTQNTFWSFVVVFVATTVAFLSFIWCVDRRPRFWIYLHLLTSGDLGGYTQGQKRITLCCSTCRFSNIHLNRYSLFFLTDHCQNYGFGDNNYKPGGFKAN